VNVTVECLCPGAAHPDGDTITLRERLDFQGATGVRQVLFLVAQDDPSATDAQYAAALAEHYLLYGIESWTLVDADRKPIPVTKRAIREYVLSRPVEVRELSDEAQARFNPQVLAPLVAAASKSSPSTSTDSSTSAPTDSQPKPLKRSSRSSTTTTRTDGIATITSLPDGASSTSPSSTSAA
jgi:hypothetical protein